MSRSHLCLCRRRPERRRPFSVVSHHGELDFSIVDSWCICFSRHGTSFSSFACAPVTVVPSIFPLSLFCCVLLVLQPQAAPTFHSVEVFGSRSSGVVLCMGFLTSKAFAMAICPAGGCCYLLLLIMRNAMMTFDCRIVLAFAFRFRTRLGHSRLSRLD